MSDVGNANKDQQPKKFSEFLESTPPNVFEEIADLSKRKDSYVIVAEPDLQLHCSSEACQGLRFFRCTSYEMHLLEAEAKNRFMVYVCRNCERMTKTYALLVRRAKGSTGRALKYGELPSFGPPVPSRVISLIGPDRQIFLQGRRAENQGLGIGAFAYYRRVVENQKGRIISEIGKVAQRLGTGAQEQALFEKAAEENQFSTAIDLVRDTIPRSLLIDQHNPLTLLHSALSEGIHAQDDETCLQIAEDIRVVLTELADRISQSLKDQAELKQAVSRLLNRGKPE